MSPIVTVPELFMSAPQNAKAQVGPLMSSRTNGWMSSPRTAPSPLQSPLMQPSAGRTDRSHRVGVAVGVTTGHVPRNRTCTSRNRPLIVDGSTVLLFAIVVYGWLGSASRLSAARTATVREVPE